MRISKSIAAVMTVTLSLLLTSCGGKKSALQAGNGVARCVDTSATALLSGVVYSRFSPSSSGLIELDLLVEDMGGQDGIPYIYFIMNDAGQPKPMAQGAPVSGDEVFLGTISELEAEQYTIFGAIPDDGSGLPISDRDATYATFCTLPYPGEEY